MKPAAFSYETPTTLDEARTLLSEGGGDKKLLAGGQSLIPLLNMRLARPDVVIDMNGVQGLSGILEEEEWIRIQALVRERQAERSEVVRTGSPLLHEAIGWIGHPEIRNRGTIVGSVAHADPASEIPAVLVALDGEVAVLRGEEEIVIPASDFFVTYLTTALESADIVTEIRIPVSPRGSGSSFTEFARRVGDFAIVGVASQITLEGGEVKEARLALSGVADVPFRAREAERILEEKGAGAVRVAARAVRDSVDPESDIHATGDYRRHLAFILTEKALGVSIERAGGRVS